MFLFLFLLFTCKNRTYSELQAASEDWMSDYADSDVRRTSVIAGKDYLPASDLIRKSIRRSWTISSKYSYIHRSGFGGTPKSIYTRRFPHVVVGRSLHSGPNRQFNRNKRFLSVIVDFRSLSSKKLFLMKSFTF